MLKLTVGQKLWWVPHQLRFNNPREVTVEKVGRVWAYLDNHQRIDVETLRVDAGEGAPRGRVYLSEAEYLRETELRDRWSALKRALSDIYVIPEGVTPEDIAAATKLLRLPENKNEH
ncbi:ethanolamine ammonia-lyase [Novimethylophilus kurashikiensis]|uniref:Ethanolamine ammonia-lyase n=1 Tax=Novimethylophilus kurashikiensis TaxID=1825523 RepID=A0A2R5FCD3_9PROT|nr:hypothetical protein [Novimethylophilus kurashikiensis]GBG14593.1 ethanolamine ammonia-lyase [Novimethylophilus kurashikiensis]